LSLLEKVLLLLEYSSILINPSQIN